VENRGRLIEKSEFMSRLWPDTFVEEVTLAGNISELRRVLGDRSNGTRYIETVPKSGYRFLPEVAMVEPAAGLPKPEPGRAAVATPGKVIIAVAALAMLGAVEAALWAWRTPAPPAAIRSIAVLPFRALSPGQDEPTFALGLADTLIGRLSNLSRLSVRPASAVRKYLDAADPLAAGRELRVDAVLAGTIQRDAGSVRVEARLVNAGDGRILWSGSFDRQPTQLFALEDSLASEAAGAIAVRLSGQEKKLLTKHDTESPEAYQAYMKGRFFWNKRDLEGFQKAIGYFEEAIRRDPGYAKAYAGLADLHLLVGGYSYVPQKDVIAKSRAAVEQALQLDNTLAEAHTTLALIHENYDWDWPATEREYKLAIRFNPSHATAHGWYGEFLSYMGRGEESMAEMRQALDLDPLNLSLNTDSCKVFYFTRQYDKAIEQCKRVLELDPGFVPAQNRLASTYAVKGMFPEALAEAQRLPDADSPFLLVTLGGIYAAAGDRNSALRYARLISARAEREYVPPLVRFGIPLWLGEYDEALTWLEKTYEDRDVGLIILKTEPSMDPLRGNPRFQALLRKMNF